MDLHEQTFDLNVPFRRPLSDGIAFATFEVVVTYEYERPIRARWGEPSEGGTVDIRSVQFRRDGSNVWRNLPRRAYDERSLCDIVYDRHDDDYDAGAYADYRYEQWRDERDMRRAAE